eukprot:632234-Pyramimonas_sp.AAC.1
MPPAGVLRARRRPRVPGDPASTRGVRSLRGFHMGESVGAPAVPQTARRSEGRALRAQEDPCLPSRH